MSYKMNMIMFFGFLVGMSLNGLFSDHIFIVICRAATMRLLRWTVQAAGAGRNERNADRLQISIRSQSKL